MIREQAYYSAGNFIKIGSYDDSPRENVLSLPPEDERVERLAAAYMAAFYEMAGSIIRRCIDGLIHETTLPTQLQVIDHNISNLIEITTIDQARLTHWRLVEVTQALASAIPMSVPNGDPIRIVAHIHSLQR
jgi:hypothetical protein